MLFRSNGVTGTGIPTAGTSGMVPNLQQHSYTIAFWCRPDNLATVQSRYLFAQQTNSPGTSAWQSTPSVQARNTGVFRFAAANANATNNQLGSVNYSFNDIYSPWHCFVYSYTAAPDGSATWVAYGDSVTSTGTGTIDPDGTLVVMAKSGFFQLGGVRTGMFGTGAAGTFMGAIDSMAVWNRALDKSEAAMFFNMGRD